MNPGADLYGADRMALETASALMAGGARVVVALPESGDLADALQAAGATVVLTPMAVLRKAFASPSGLLRLGWAGLRSLPPTVRLLRRVRPSVVVVNTVTAPLWLIIAKLLRTGCVCHVHEAEQSAAPVVLKALNLPLLLTDRLIVNSEFSRSVLLRSMPQLAPKSVVIYNAVSAPADIPPARRTIDGPLRVGYVGRLSPRKGPDIAISAIAELRGQGIAAELDLVGDVFSGYEWFRDQLESQVAALRLGDGVRFHGFQQDVWRYTAGCDVIVVPSTVGEPFGNTAVEAALAQRPVVASDIAGLREATDGFQAALRVPAGDAAALAAALRTVRDNWPRFQSSARLDAELARRRYSASRYTTEITRIVTSVAPAGTTAQSDAAIPPWEAQ